MSYRPTPRIPYQMVNPPSSMRASLGRTFIYVLNFSLPGSKKLIPFYVGKSQQLSRRFSNHTQVNWHYAKLNIPVKIYIAGTVENHNANEAEQDLITSLSKADYQLTNSYIRDIQESQKQKSIDLFSKTPKEVREYLSSVPTQTNCIKEWADYWKPKTSSTKTKESGKVTRDAVIKHMENQNYDSPEAKEFSLKIAALFNSEKGSASLDISNLMVGKEEKVRAAKIVKQVKREWVFHYDDSSSLPNRFTLTKKGIQSITRA